MDKSNLKLEELRLIFERENTRKQNLENKASYFLVVISIIMTIICTYFNQTSLPKFNIINGIIFIISIVSFLISILLCIIIFLPRNYYHPFDLENFKDFEKSFKIPDDEFEEKLYDQYLVSTYTNHEKNEDIVKRLKYSVYSFVFFIVLLILSVVIL